MVSSKLTPGQMKGVSERNELAQSFRHDVVRVDLAHVIVPATDEAVIFNTWIEMLKDAYDWNAPPETQSAMEWEMWDD